MSIWLSARVHKKAFFDSYNGMILSTGRCKKKKRGTSAAFIGNAGEPEHMACMTLFQTLGNTSDTGAPETPFRMTEGEIMLGPGHVGFYVPEYKTLARLYCLNGGYHLRILPDGTVDGEREETDVYTLLRTRAVSVGVVVIQGVEAGHYLAMDREGLLYGTKMVNEECHFHEKIEENNYNTYSSQRHGHGLWYLGMKKNGRLKRGPRTRLGQKAVYFLPRPADGAGKNT